MWKVVELLQPKSQKDDESLFEMKPKCGDQPSILFKIKSEKTEPELRNFSIFEDNDDVLSCLFSQSDPVQVRDSQLQIQEKMKLQADEYKKIQERIKQEDSDRKFAEKLQKSLDKGKDLRPPRTYGLRSWVKRLSK
jgi:hypothetical protein